jgi:hypothetical protein
MTDKSLAMVSLWLILIVVTLFLLIPFLDLSSLPGWGDDPIFCGYTLKTIALNFERGYWPWQDKFWNIDLFYPSRRVLAFSDPLILPGFLIYCLHSFLGIPLILSINILFVVFLTAGWLVCWRFFKALGVSSPVALGGGWLWAFSSHILSQSAHYQNSIAFAIPLILLGVVTCWRETPKKWTHVSNKYWYGTLICIVGILLISYTNLYYFYFSLIATAVVLIILYTFERKISKVCGTLLPIVCTLPLVIPLIWRYFEVKRLYGAALSERPFWLQQHFAARVADYFSSNLVSPLYNEIIPASVNFERNAFSGLITTIIALCSLPVGMYIICKKLCTASSFDSRIETVQCLGISISLITVGVLFSSGPLFAPYVYEQLRGILPGFSDIRAVGRIGILVVLGEVLLMITIADLLLKRVKNSRLNYDRVSFTSANLLNISIVILFCLEIAERIVPSYQTWHISVENELQGKDPVLEMIQDSATKGAVWELAPTSSANTNITALRRAIFHDRPLVNGYSGFEPVEYSLNDVDTLMTDCPLFISRYKKLLAVSKLIALYGYPDKSKNSIRECLNRNNFTFWKEVDGVIGMVPLS